MKKRDNERKKKLATRKVQITRTIVGDELFEFLVYCSSMKY